MLVSVNVVLSYTILIVSLWSACRQTEHTHTHITINLLSTKHAINHIRGGHTLPTGQWLISFQIVTRESSRPHMSEWIIKFDIIFMKAELPYGTVLSLSLLPFTQLSAGVAKCPFIFKNVHIIVPLGVLYEMRKLRPPMMKLDTWMSIWVKPRTSRLTWKKHQGDVVKTPVQLIISAFSATQNYFIESQSGS